MTRYGWLFWFPLVALIIIIAYQILLFRKNKLIRRRKKKDTAAQIAHTRYIRNLPEYKKARKRYNLLIVLSAILYVAAISSLTFLSARPISVTESKEEKENRDIMLCLDVSGSMYNYIEDLSLAFMDLVKKMEGERFGITIFDGDYATMSPLSDDYASLLSFLEELKDPSDLSKYSGSLNYSIGISNGYNSEIGAGLIGCADSFDRIDELERSRIIILATDNRAPDSPIVSLEQAAYYVRDKNITLYGLNIADYAKQEDIDSGTARYRGKEEIEFQNATAITGGSYYAINSTTGVVPQKIITQIMTQEAARYEGAGQLIRSDVPEVAAIVSAIILVVLIVIVWRLYL